MQKNTGFKKLIYGSNLHKYTHIPQIQQQNNSPVQESITLDLYFHPNTPHQCTVSLYPEQVLLLKTQIKQFHICQ